jgi:hypothetical protein
LTAELKALNKRALRPALYPAAVWCFPDDVVRLLPAGRFQWPKLTAAERALCGPLLRARWRPIPGTATRPVTMGAAKGRKIEINLATVRILAGSRYKIVTNSRNHLTNS